jgi:cytoskeletal protein CcmA (bactofilin family)
MWSSKKDELETPPTTAPTSPEVQETNYNKPTSTATGGSAATSEPIRVASTTPARETSRWGANLRIKGEISGREPLHVDGQMEGLIQLEGAKLTVGTSGKLSADLVATEIIVHGSVRGKLHGHGRIEIKKDSSVIGSITTAAIRIEDGAYLKGEIEIVQKPVQRTSPQEAASGVLVPALADKIAS